MPGSHLVRGRNSQFISNIMVSRHVEVMFIVTNLHCIHYKTNCGILRCNWDIINKKDPCFAHVYHHELHYIWWYEYFFFYVPFVFPSARDTCLEYPTDCFAIYMNIILQLFCSLCALHLSLCEARMLKISQSRLQSPSKKMIILLPRLYHMKQNFNTTIIDQ